LVEVSNEDLERLANRVALLVSNEGEADNAGRAVAALARRMAISGGELRAWLISGALALRGDVDHSLASGKQNPPRARLESEIANLQHGLRLTEAQLRNIQSERDALREENNLLIEALDRSRSSEQVRNYLGLAVIAAAILGGVVLYAGPALHSVSSVDSQQRPFGSPFLRSGIVRPGGTVVRRLAQTNSMQITELPAGSRVQVRDIVTRDLAQWAEIEVGGVIGFALSHEIEVQDIGGR
jgi:hypothetical protein